METNSPTGKVSMSKRRIVIAGMGAVTPLGNSVEAFWDGLVAGRNGIGEITAFDCREFSAHIAGQCDDFSPRGLIEPRLIKRLDRFAQFAMVAAIEAVNDSGLDMAAEDPYRVGVIIGSGIGGIKELEDQHLRLMEK